MGPCNTCKHFRPCRPLTQLLARDLGTDDSQVTAELNRMMQDERQKLESEAAQLPELLRHDKTSWQTKPEMTDYCGLHESEGKYYFPDEKNADGRCHDHNPDKRDRACSDCQHQVIGNGKERD